MACFETLGVEHIPELQEYERREEDRQLAHGQPAGRDRPPEQHAQQYRDHDNAAREKRARHGARNDEFIARTGFFEHHLGVRRQRGHGHRGEGIHDDVHQETENPKYSDGTKREIVQFFYDVNPGGQAIQCSTMQPVNLTRLPIYSLAIIVLTTGAGVWIFKKKDLK